MSGTILMNVMSFCSLRACGRGGSGIRTRIESFVGSVGASSLEAAEEPPTSTRRKAIC